MPRRGGFLVQLHSFVFREYIHANRERRVEDFASTASEVATVEAEVSDIELTKAIDAIKQTVRSGRHVKPSQKVKLNTEQELAFR